MTITLPNTVSPEPPHGVKEFLSFVAVAAVGYVISVLMLAAIFRVGP
jgi:hypothetical protein